MKALAKKSTANRRKEHSVEKYLEWVAMLSLTIRVYLHSFSTVVATQICEIPRNSPKIRTYSSSRSSKVIDPGVNRKRIRNCLLSLIVPVTLDVSPTVFEMTFEARKWLVSHPSLVWRFRSGELIRICGWNVTLKNYKDGENCIILTSTVFDWSTAHMCDRQTDGR